VVHKLGPEALGDGFGSYQWDPVLNTCIVDPQLSQRLPLGYGSLDGHDVNVGPRGLVSALYRQEKFLRSCHLHGLDGTFCDLTSERYDALLDDLCLLEVREAPLEKCPTVNSAVLAVEADADETPPVNSGRCDEAIPGLLGVAGLNPVCRRPCVQQLIPVRQLPIPFLAGPGDNGFLGIDYSVNLFIREGSTRDLCQVVRRSVVVVVMEPVGVGEVRFRQAKFLRGRSSLQ